MRVGLLRPSLTVSRCGNAVLAVAELRECAVIRCLFTLRSLVAQRSRVANLVSSWSAKCGGRARLAIDAKHLCEMSVDQVANRAPATARLVDWFLGEVAA
jgi:hypothetical protein